MGRSFSKTPGDYMKGRMNWVARFWVPVREWEKNSVKKDLADAAGEDCESLLEYADRQAIDPAQAQDLVETLVEDIAAKQRDVRESKKIRKARPYLFTAFVRAVNALRAKENRVERVAVGELERLAIVEDWPKQQDQRILVKEIISMMDPETRRTYWRLAELYSWKEIARQQGVSVNTAIAAYVRGLKKVRAKIEKEGGKRK